MKKFSLLVLISIMILLGCNKYQNEVIQTINNSTNWLYQLQHLDIDKVVSSGYTTVVMDYSKEGDDETRYSSYDIKKLKDSGVIPIAYISIGEAEEYRYYWDNNWEKQKPSWLGNENLDWEGNYKVRYWDDGWKQIVFDYLDKIQEAGFDGVYLDIVDAYEYWGNMKSDCINEKEAAKRMISFVREIGEYCRRNDEDFLIIPQNGEELIHYDEEQIYMNTISGIGIEDLWYDDTNKKSEEEIRNRLQYLRKIKQHHKPILVVDYVDDGKGYRGENKYRIDDFIQKCLREGFKYYIGVYDRELDIINYQK